ncbi:sigma-70 family RNA polymerase sigma factor [Sphingomonas bacterium]|uniref:sigma-70 family RNA polymerase sigma factor n=1 Tax=Sphingomonas bacterium TaxID=1895847 RepID=UPI001575F4D3|nr:sigma-70 family RNA polymerase sigma factor [Sphingomonas bacterium]
MSGPTVSLQHDVERLVAVIAGIAAGDRAALAKLYGETSGKLFAVCRRILIDGYDAEEALQETYIAIWRRAGSFDATRGSPATWLAVIARNCAIDRLRLRRRSPTSPIEQAAGVADVRPSAFELASASHDERRLHECLGELAAGDRAFIATAFFEGESYATLAMRESLPLGTVKSRIRRALIKLRECLE